MRKLREILNDLWKYIFLSVASMFLGQIYMWFGIGKFIKKIKLNKLQVLSL